MGTLTLRALVLALGLAVLAGYVDALAYLTLSGFFVSFMSGNTTAGAVQLTTGGGMIAMVLVVSFVAGVVIGMLAGRAPARWRATVILGVVAVFLVAAALVGTTVDLLMAALLAVGMGAVNTVFSRDSHGGFGLTYMTGALVKVGQGIVEAFGPAAKGKRFEWVRYLLMWVAIAVGAVVGALVHGSLGLVPGLWIAAGVAVLAAVVGGREVDRQFRDPTLGEAQSVPHLGT